LILKYLGLSNKSNQVSVMRSLADGPLDLLVELMREGHED